MIYESYVCVIFSQNNEDEMIITINKTMKHLGMAINEVQIETLTYNKKYSIV